ncbi:MAG: insulinase family protein [Lentisphaerae bacterium]|nr:insulinase family protein [Lentisphaerota bacterium]
MGILSRTITTELDNGIRLCYFHQPGASVEFQFHVTTGSIHEREFLGCGLSHFLEHMAFQGCAGYPARSVAETVNALGGNVNAYTSYDRTCYTMQIPVVHWRKAVDMLCAMVRYPEFPEARFVAEKEVILRECERGNDEPDRKIFQRFLRTMFREHPMRHPVIGYPEMISSVTRDMMVSYHQERYAPENCIIVAVGDLNAVDFFEAFNEKLGDWKRHSLMPYTFPDEPLPISARRSELEFPDSVERIFCGVRGPRFGAADAPALELLFGVLGIGEGSILNRKLILERPLALGVGSFCYSLCGLSFAGISAKCEPGKRNKFQSALLKELEAVAEGKIPKAHVEREKGQVYADYLRNLRDPANVAGEIAGGMIYDNSPATGDVFLRQLQNIGIDEVRMAAEKYLDLSHWVWVNQVNKSGKTKTPASLASVPIEKTLTSAGVPVLYVPESRLPLCNCFVVISGGILHEPDGCCGISKLLAAVFMSGGGKYNEVRLLEKFDECGMDLVVSPGANSITVGFSAPKRKMNRAMELLCSLFKEPHFAADAVEREKNRCLESVYERAAVPVRAAFDRASRLLYGSHPYAYRKTGKVEEIEKIDRQMLLEYFGDCCAGKKAYGFGGDCSAADVTKWAKMLDDALGGKGGKVLKSPALPVFPDKVLSESFVLPREQTVVLRMLPGIASACDPDIDLLEILHHAENGLASTLFKVVREENALSYSVGMNFIAGFHPGAITFYAMTAAGAQDEVMALLEKEIERLAKSGLSAKEFEAAQHGMLFDLERMFDSVDTLLSNAVMDAYYGRELEELLDRKKRIAALDVDEFNRRIRKFFQKSAGVKLTVLPDGKN